LEKVYDLEVFEKQIIKINAELIDKNAKLYDISRDVLEEHNKTLARNKMLMKENINLYKQFKLLTKDPQTSSQKQLAKLATTLDEETEPSTQKIEVVGTLLERQLSPKQS
jgi:hypothetical protein